MKRKKKTCGNLCEQRGEEQHRGKKRVHTGHKPFFKIKDAMKALLRRY
jgi:hypothetical protein